MTDNSTNTNRKNKIFDCLWGMLGHPSSVEKQFHPGNFDTLKKLVDKVNPNAKNVGNIANIMTQIKLHNSNSAGKKFVGIAALNNISHAISNFAKLKIKPLQNTYKINGVSTDMFSNEDGFIADATYSIFDGSRISRTLGMFVGASADNAKEAVLGALNITPITANLSMAMIRMGIPIDIIAGIMNLKEIKEISVNGSSFDFINELLELEEGSVNTADVDIRFEDLVDMINGKENIEVLNACIALLKEVHYVSLGYGRFNNIASLNSTKNAVGPEVYDVLKKTLQIELFDREYEDSRQDNGIFTDSIELLYNKVPFLQPLRQCYTELVPEICQNWSPVFSNEFDSILEILRTQFYWAADTLTPEVFKFIVNSFLVYNSTKHLNINPLNLIREFYKDTIKIKNDFNERGVSNKLIDLLQINSIKDNKDLNEVILRITALSKSDLIDVSAAWSDLQQINKEYADKLVCYFNITLGYHWNPISGITLAPYTVKSNIEGYNKIFIDFDLFDVTNFLKLLFGNLTGNSKLWEEYSLEDIQENEDGSISLSDASKYTNLITDGKNFYMRDIASEDSDRFIKVNPLGIKGKFYEYNANNTDLKSIITKEEKEKEDDYSSEETPEMDMKVALKNRIFKYVNNLLLKNELADTNTESSKKIWQDYLNNNKNNIISRLTGFYKKSGIEYTEMDVENIYNKIYEEGSKYCM